MSTYLTAFCFFSRGCIKPKKLVAALSLAALKTSNSRLAFCCLFSSSLTTLHSKGLGSLNGVLDACLDCDRGRPLKCGVFALIHVGSLLFSLYIISVFCSFQVMRACRDAVSNVEKIVKSCKRKTNNIVQCKRTFNEGSFTWPHYRISSGDSKARFLLLAPKIPGSVTSSCTVLFWLLAWRRARKASPAITKTAKQLYPLVTWN